MEQQKKKYYNSEWIAFADKIKKRDDYKCIKCGRKEPEVVLHTHHLSYKPELEPWKYPLSDCVTLCKDCHAREHGLIEPDRDWTLVSIEDLGGLIGKCERSGCGSAIRYEHLTYHPQWGYKIVGSTCIEHLTQADQNLSEKILKIFKRISNFLYKTEWKKEISPYKEEYLFASFAHNHIYIYEVENEFSFQIAMKIRKKLKGRNVYNYKERISSRGKSLDSTKELSIIVLMGLMTKDSEEKDLLRNIYRRMR